MSDPIDTTLTSTIKTNHTAAETGGVTFPDGTVLSRAGIEATYAASAQGAKDAALRVANRAKLATWEQEQINAAKDAAGVRGTGIV